MLGKFSFLRAEKYATILPLMHSSMLWLQFEGSANFLYQKLQKL